MSTTAPADPILGSSTGKKKNNKKKKSAAAKAASTAGAVKAPEQDAEKTEASNIVETEDDAEDVETTAPNTPREESFTEKKEEVETNGHNGEVNGQPVSAEPPTSSPTKARGKESTATLGTSEDGIDSVGSDTTDASSRLEAMSVSREALRVEVEQLRRQLENIQNAHIEELSSLRTELEESETAKEHAEDQYSNLLGKINSIKATLGERMKADKEALTEANERNEDLEAQNENLREKNENLREQVAKLEEEQQETSRDLSSLRNRNNLSQQNWVKERDDLVQTNKHLKEEAEAAKEAMGDWEVLAMEERSIREGLAERVAELEDQLSDHKEAYERTSSERDSQSQAVEGLQRALGDIQEARKTELREMVERTESQLEALNKLVQQAETRATEAESAKKSLESKLARAEPFEKEVKEKNLLIGKLRHEAIVLNDHLTKALRFLKKAKPEDNIDRQIVTNHFLHFLALDRSDPKKFQILQLIASLLGWTEEQKEQAGLARPGGASSTLRLPLSPFHRTPSTPSLHSEFFPETPGGAGRNESLAELWQGFLERQAEEGSVAGSRSASFSLQPLSKGKPEKGEGS